MDNTLAKIKELIQTKFGIPSHDVLDEEPFVVIGISSMQMANFLVDVEENFAVTIDFRMVNFFELDSPRKLATHIHRRFA